MDDSEVPEAQPDDVEFTLDWDRDLENGGLEGAIEAVNVSSQAVRLSGKPTLSPLGNDGRPLDTECIFSMEFRAPGYAVLNPGEKATAPAGWAGWNGPPASGQVTIGWPGGERTVVATGPLQPAPQDDPPTNLWTSWFTAVP